MDARAFQASLQPASWNGIPFHVSRDDIEAGHRLQTTAIPHGGHVVEAFGETLRQFKVDAYVTGTEARGRVALLLNNMTKTGKPGSLVLPLYGPKRCRVTKASRAFDKDKLGWLGFTIEAQEEPASPGPNALSPGSGLAGTLAGLAGFASGLTLNGLANLAFANVAGAFGLAASSIGQIFTLGAGIVGQALGLASALQVDRLVSIVEDLRLDPATRATLRPVLQAVADVTPAFEAGAPDAPAQFMTALAAFAPALASAAPAPALIETLSAIPAPPRRASGPSVTATIVAANDEAINLTVEIALALAAIESAAETTFETREEATAVRRQLAAASASVRGRCDGRLPGLSVAMVDALSPTVEIIARRIADLRPLAVVEGPANLPARWWAHRLHGDGSLSGTIASQARASHPAWMPKRFEAAAAT